MVIFVKTAPAGRSTREIAALPKAFGLRDTSSRFGWVGGGIVAVVEAAVTGTGSWTAIGAIVEDNSRSDVGV